MNRNDFLKNLLSISILLTFVNCPAQVTIKNATGNPLATADKNLLPVYDLDSNKYTVIKIGKQYWLKENLRTTQYNDTTAIATGLSDNEWKQTKSGAFSIYENNSLYEATYENCITVLL